ncbi:MAG: DNA-processing protein DprA, partial [Clostridiales bacterium]
MNQIAYILAIHSLNRLSSAKITALLAYFQDDAAAAWQNRNRWWEIIPLQRQLNAEIVEAATAINPAQLYVDYLQSGASLVNLADQEYPPSLRELHDPPYLLFYKGSLPKAEEPALALIGSRQATPYGRQVAEILARDLAYQGYCIISGMARGIDSFCHKAALLAEGRTVAVLGSGIDVIYPRENAKLYQQITEHGAVISEFPLGMAALGYNFPRRNRIISGLSLGVVVIEASEKSGTLRTVDFGLEQGKDIFAVPGSIISAQSRGTNRLIREGAKMVLTAEDIWQEYQSAAKPQKQLKTTEKGQVFSPLEQKLLHAMLMPLHFDELTELSDMEASAVASLLTIMEIRGLIRQ